MELKQLLSMLMERKAQTLHLVGGSPPLTKSAGGMLTPIAGDPMPVADVRAIIENALNADQKTILQRDRELNTSYSVEGVGRFRMSVFYQRGTLAGIFRLTPPTPQNLDELGLPPMLKDAIVKPQGLVLIVGPKGSGRSQTLAALMDYLLSSRAIQIISLENPIEYLLKNKKGVIYQREVGSDVPSFKQGLGTALRQSPDVLALSDLPDYDTTAGVLAAASAGQLVIASMTANGVVMALEQMIEMAPPHFQQSCRSQLSAALELAISQLLLSKKGGGLVLAVEILIGNLQSKNLIREGKFTQLVQCMNNSREAGMISQELALRNLGKKNLIESDEAIAKACRPEELRRLAALPI